MSAANQLCAAQRLAYLPPQWLCGISVFSPVCERIAKQSKCLAGSCRAAADTACTAAGVNVALSDPLSFVLEAFIDAWGFPADAMLTMLSKDGSQSSVAAIDLAVGSQVRSMHPKGNC